MERGSPSAVGEIGAAAASSVAACYVVFAAGVCAALHVGKLSPAIGVLQQTLGVSLVEAGFLLSIVQLAGMTMAIFTGALVDGLGLRRSMVLGLVVLALASAWGAMAVSPGQLMLLRAIEGFGFLWVVLPGPALIRQLAPPSRSSQMLGLWGAYMPLGIAIGLLFGSWWIEYLGWRSWWWGSALLSAAMAWGLASTRLPVVQAPAQSVPASSFFARLKRTLSHPGPWMVAWVFAAYSGQWLAVVAFLPSIYEQQGVPVGWRSVLTAMVALANLVGNIWAGRLLQRGVKSSSLLLTGFIAMGLCAVVAFVGLDAAQPDTQGVAVLRYLALIAFSAVCGLIPTTLISLTLKLAPDQQTVATTLGWMQQWSAAGQFFGPPLVAYIAERVGGWAWTWVPLGVLSALGVGLTLVIASRFRVAVGR